MRLCAPQDLLVENLAIMNSCQVETANIRFLPLEEAKDKILTGRRGRDGSSEEEEEEEEEEEDLFVFKDTIEGSSEKCPTALCSEKSVP